MSYHMPPKYIGLFSKEDKHGKLQWKIIPCDTKEEIFTVVEITMHSGHTRSADSGTVLNPRDMKG